MTAKSAPLSRAAVPLTAVDGMLPVRPVEPDHARLAACEADAESQRRWADRLAQTMIRLEAG